MLNDDETRIHNYIVETFRSSEGRKPTRAECYELALAMLREAHPQISSGYVRRARPSGMAPKAQPEAILIPGEQAP